MRNLSPERAEAKRAYQARYYHENKELVLKFAHLPPSRLAAALGSGGDELRKLHRIEAAAILAELRSKLNER